MDSDPYPDEISNRGAEIVETEIWRSGVDETGDLMISLLFL